MRTFRPGFTLLEMLVVIAIIAMLAAMILPRLTGNARRDALFAADEVADLMTIFAHRATVSDARIALSYDKNAGVVSVIEQLGDPTNPSDPPRWDFDAYGSQVRLPGDMVVSAVRRDGRLFSHEADWFLPVIPGEGRPNIEVELTSDSLEERMVVYLPSFEVAAKVIVGDDDEHTHRLPLDLDAVGRTRESW